MKLARPPKTFTFIFISLIFLIVQFSFVNRYMGYTNQDPLPKPENTQSIPDTYLPVVVDTIIDHSASRASAFAPADSAGEDYSTLSSKKVEPLSSDALLEEISSAEFYAESLRAETLPESATSPGEVLDGVGLVVENNNDLEFERFLEEVTNGDEYTITGIYVAGLFRLRVLQQPPQDAAYVSNEDGTATQFQSPALYGVIGMLAHNFLSGKHFYSLVPGQEIRIIYGNGSFRNYQITGFADFERMTRFDIRSDFRDLQTDELVSSRDLFARFYQDGNYLTLQTCLEGEGYSNWGVRMISAVPMEDEG
jgi:hypothetical protein